MLLNGPSEIAEAVKEWGPIAEAEWVRLNHFEDYYYGRHRAPYEPETVTREFRELVHRGVTNLTRLIVNTLTQRLIVDGFRPSETTVENAPQWEWWQANGLDARQKALYDEAAKHGYAGCMVLPGEPVPVMRPVSPREWWIGFDDYSDDWPMLALKKPKPRLDQPQAVNDKTYSTWHVLDDEMHYVVRIAGSGQITMLEESRHGLHNVPIVPFRNTWNLTRYPDGEIEPAIAIQDRLNQTCFDLLVAQTYAAAPQKWATGITLPTDSAGKPIVDLRAFAKSLWMTNDENAKFGSLPEANLANLVGAIDNCLRVYGLSTQTPPHYLLGEMVNLSAEALLAVDTTLAKKVGDRQTLFGEAWEQTFRLAGVAAGDETAANDTEAQVWWRDTEPRSIAQQVDALGKMSQMLQIPPSALWEKVPGTTGADLSLWRTEEAKQRLRALRAGPTVTTPPVNAAKVPGVPGGTAADRALGKGA